MTSKEFKDFVNSLAIEWFEVHEEREYDSIIQFLDDKNFGRDFYLSLNPNDIIHEVMRNELGIGVADVKEREIVLSGIMECYDFCSKTKDMTNDEILDFVNYED